MWQRALNRVDFYIRYNGRYLIHILTFMVYKSWLKLKKKLIVAKVQLGFNRNISVQLNWQIREIENEISIYLRFFL